MAVAHLKKTSRRENAGGITQPPDSSDQFRAGYVDCTAEITRFLSTTKDSGGGLREALFQHLAKSIATLPRNPTRNNENINYRLGERFQHETPNYGPMMVGTSQNGCNPVGVNCPCLCAHAQFQNVGTYACFDNHSAIPMQVQRRSYPIPRHQFPLLSGIASDGLESGIECHVKRDASNENFNFHNEAVSPRGNCIGRNHTRHWRPW
ncbi:uncharacterized protein LOC106179584 [Lingula anatina]|uniref:Uncharacterized protein LOC106179584 n=1 Tax=Lingula anatina TaxID=7574 RepID=A0A1S3K7Y9_LINAN|nr:uncharacterized protein LOC106179584 [Lingula anatina]|eukprot:XP_013418743.1 uncharacterized protein LOC106179584 [Lingula anatina]